MSEIAVGDIVWDTESGRIMVAHYIESPWLRDKRSAYLALIFKCERLGSTVSEATDEVDAIEYKAADDLYWALRPCRVYSAVEPLVFEVSDDRKQAMRSALNAHDSAVRLQAKLATWLKANTEATNENDHNG